MSYFYGVVILFISRESMAQPSLKGLSSNIPGVKKLPENLPTKFPATFPPNLPSNIPANLPTNFPGLAGLSGLPGLVNVLGSLLNGSAAQLLNGSAAQGLPKSQFLTGENFCGLNLAGVMMSY